MKDTKKGMETEEGNGNSLQYSCWGNPMDRGAWRTTVRGVSKSRSWHHARLIFFFRDIELNAKYDPYLVMD